MTNPFHFQQFTIHQQQAAMKVGTDGVLLGAWATVNHAKTILDIGTGTGLLSLMAAQRNTEAQITAIEINQQAVNEARFNVQKTPWSDRINIIHTSLQQFAQDCSTPFDLIICNPPFFNGQVSSKPTARELARNEQSMTIEDIASSSKKLLHKKGRIACVYPSQRTTEVCSTFRHHKLHLQRICAVRPTNQHPPKRSLLEFSKTKAKTKSEELVIEPERRHEYSKEYKDLTKQFYLD